MLDTAGTVLNIIKLTLGSETERNGNGIRSETERIGSGIGAERLDRLDRFNHPNCVYK